MKREAQARLELFSGNLKTIKKGISMTFGTDRRTAALLYAVKGKTINRTAIEDSYAVLKKATSSISSFRQHAPLCVAAMLSLETDPKGTLDRALAVYGMLRDIKFRSSSFLAIAALQIATGAKPKDHQTAVARMRSFYDRMKEKNWLHTGADDYILAAMFALSGADEGSAVDSIEELYQRLRREFRSKGGVLALAQVLVIGGQTAPSAAERVLALRDALKAKKIRLDRSSSIPSLGILSQLPVDADKVAQEIKDAETFLRAQEGMGTPKEIQLYAAAIVSSMYPQDAERGLISASVSTSMINILISLQIAMIMIIVTVTTTVAASR
jgi:hypothetical protein